MSEYNWRMYLEDYFGLALSEDKASRWADLLYQDVDVDAAELADVVRWVSDRKEKRFGKPTLEDVKIWVRWYRKESRAARCGYKAGDDFIGSVKTAMLKAPDMRRRWDILCSPDYEAGLARACTVDECELLDAWAARRWSDWAVASEKIRAGVSRATADALKAIDWHARVATWKSTKRNAQAPACG